MFLKRTVFSKYLVMYSQQKNKDRDSTTTLTAVFATCKHLDDHNDKLACPKPN